MAPHRLTGSAVLVAPVRPSLSLAGTTTPERRSVQSPVPPLGAWHAGNRVPVPLCSLQCRRVRDSHSQNAPRQSGAQGPPSACRRPPAASSHGPVSAAARRPRVRRCVGSYGGARGGPAGVAVAMAMGKRSARAMAERAEERSKGRTPGQAAAPRCQGTRDPG
ncbi:unnamed protein product [Coccothraustes coccothraustes]